MRALEALIVVGEPVGGTPAGRAAPDLAGPVHAGARLSAHHWVAANGRTCTTIDLAAGAEPDEPTASGSGAPDSGRSVYRCVQLHPGTLVAPADADYLYLVRLRPDPAVEEEWNRWYSDEHVPSLAAVGGVVCARRFRAHTPDRLGRRYLALYHMTAPDIPQTAEWKRASDSPWTRRMKPHHQADKVLDVFRRLES